MSDNIAYNVFKLLLLCTVLVLGTKGILIVEQPQTLDVPDEHVVGEKDHIGGHYFVECGDNDSTYDVNIEFRHFTNTVAESNIHSTCTQNESSIQVLIYNIDGGTGFNESNYTVIPAGKSDVDRLPESETEQYYLDDEHVVGNPYYDRSDKAFVDCTGNGSIDMTMSQNFHRLSSVEVIEVCTEKEYKVDGNDFTVYAPAQV